MREAPRRVRVSPRSEIALVIKQASSEGEPVLVDTGEAVYRVDVHSSEAPSAPKSRRLKGRLLSLAGVWRDLDADAMIEALYKARHEAPPSPPPEP